MCCEEKKGGIVLLKTKKCTEEGGGPEDVTLIEIKGEYSAGDATLLGTCRDLYKQCLNDSQHGPTVEKQKYARYIAPCQTIMMVCEVYFRCYFYLGSSNNSTADRNIELIFEFEMNILCEFESISKEASVLLLMAGVEIDTALLVYIL